MLAVIDMLEWLRVIEKLLRSDANSTFYCSAKVSRPSVLTQEPCSGVQERPARDGGRAGIHTWTSHLPKIGQSAHAILFMISNFIQLGLVILSSVRISLLAECWWKF